MSIHPVLPPNDVDDPVVLPRSDLIKAIGAFIDLAKPRVDTLMATDDQPMHYWQRCLCITVANSLRSYLGPEPIEGLPPKMTVPPRLNVKT